MINTTARGGGERANLSNYRTVQFRAKRTGPRPKISLRNMFPNPVQ